MASEKVDFQIQGIHDVYNVKHAVSVLDLNLPTQTLSRSIVEHIKSAESVIIQAYDAAQPKLLLGQDNWELIVTREFRDVKKYKFGISRSLLGWAIHGPCPSALKLEAFVCLSGKDQTVSCDNEETLDELIRKYFQLDNFGVCETNRAQSGQNRALEILKRTTRRMKGSWETGLLWKKDRALEIDSLTTAQKRLFALERKLDREPVYALLYYHEMDRLFANGYATKVEEVSTHEKTWYLPHFGVQNINKPGKMRLVFDAAAKSGGMSLNDQLDSGPDLLQSLPGVLIRFRQEQVAVKADIKDMFLRIQVRKEDRGAQRFLWRGKARDIEPQVFEMSCLIFGAKPSPCSAMYVKNLNARSFANAKPIASRAIISNSYMDDFLASRKTVQEVVSLVRDVVEINACANFEMHDWACNDIQALSEIADQKRSKSSQENNLCDRATERVLGLFWETRSDTLGFNVGVGKIPKSLLNGERIPTKREYLRVVMSVFDPLGFVSKFTLMSKILMQEIWRSGVGWDSPIRKEEHEGWLSWLKQLHGVQNVRIPRCVSPIGKQYVTADLHVFCDASLKAYAAAAYLRFAVKDAPAHVALIMAKTRVAPLKPLSIPRLELQAALLAARLANTVQKELEIEISQRVFWSDSITVIRWIRSEPRIRQLFVSHRLGEIGELTKVSEWRWVPSRLNPADDATRWSDAVLLANQRWFVGPDFLKQDERSWPVEKSMSVKETETIDGMELRKEFVFTIDMVPRYFPVTGKMLGWPGLLAIARRIRGFFNRWRNKPRDEIDCNAVLSAEEYWFREVQAEFFAQELDAVKKGKEINRGSKIIQLQPFLDERGILRANGRVTKIAVYEFNNNPIILEGKHPATRALVMEYHRRFFHASRDSVVNELRQGYYIIGLRSLLRSLINKCLVCKLRRGKPANPKMAALPAGRLAYRERPFTHCGIDYFGPMYVKIGRRREKRWGVIFTCLTTRAIYLEMAHSLSASSAIMALRRLTARRGSPSVIYSDNATNFAKASKELKDAIATIDVDKQKEYAAANRMKWLFIPPDAPHMGGAWERLIRSVKNAIGVVLRDQAPNEEVLLTLLAEIEHSVNSRPLTHVSIDPRDSEALTPNHFMIGTSSGALNLQTYEARAACPKNQWKIAQSFADSFWKRWLKEYLPTQIPRTKWNITGDQLAVGDIVMIIDYQAPRNTWKRGKIVEIFPGEDGIVRVAKVRTSTGEFMRPARKLIRLLIAE